jgi:hypothetical protein
MTLPKVFYKAGYDRPGVCSHEMNDAYRQIYPAISEKANSGVPTTSSFNGSSITSCRPPAGVDWGSYLWHHDGEVASGATLTV